MYRFVALISVFAVAISSNVAISHGQFTPARNLIPATSLQLPPGTVLTPEQAQAFAEAQAAGGVVTATPASGSPAAGGSVDAAAAARKQQMDARLKKLAQMKFTRLPSQILDTWSTPLEFDEKKQKEIAELPPAPKQAFLYNDLRFEIATKKLNRDLTLGNWQQIKKFMDLLPEASQKTLYTKVLQSLSGSGDRQLPGNSGANSRTDARALQQQYLRYSDVFEIAKIAPKEIEKAELSLFSAILRTITSRGNSLNDLLTMFRADLEHAEPTFEKRQVAKLLMQSGKAIEAGEFLPTIADASQQNDHEALNLLSRHFLAVYQKDSKTEDLEQAWNVTQAILAADDVDKLERKQALARAVSLVRDVREELAQQWLDDSFVKRPERGIEVLGSIGSDVAKSLVRMPTSPDSRLQSLKLQHEAVETLFKASAERAAEWSNTLELLAQNWLREAVISYRDDNSTQRGPNMNRDVYGNIYYYDPYEMQRRQQASNVRLQAIPTGKLLEVKPDDNWLNLIDQTLRPKFEMIQAQLYLKVSEEDEALPLIEAIADKYPDQIEELLKEFLRVWTKNHNPNSAQQRTNAYMYMYGFESRAQSIPLTRSKQQRNLAELKELIPRLQKLSTEPLDQDLLLSAFFTCHSTAEVYQKSEISQIFGSMVDVDPKIIAKLARRMRTNLAQTWRDVTVQKNAKTKRRKKDIEQEVVRGYNVARDVLNDSLTQHPDDWALLAVDAAILHDENNYRAELENTSEFSPRRQESLNKFKSAAELYVAQVGDLEQKDYSISAFDTWFYASLGACDLNLVKPEHVRAKNEPALIRDAIEKMPTKARDWHKKSFANMLFNRMSSAKPELKFKYLDAGFEIVGDHPAAAEARKVHEYYRDLVTEIKLESEIDGAGDVGTEPFGMYVNLAHTREIERESGGFGRYLQNQNANMYFSYNYGRPTEDYRDKFEESTRESLSEHFEVLSVTFQTPDNKSVPARGRPGWRITPYAYILLKARGPEVDTVPPVSLDLDFLDTSGYAVLPIESPTLPINAKKTSDEARPYKDLKITQILDERHALDGKLILEIKAQAHGLVPDLDKIMKLDPARFTVSQVDDQGVSISRFDELSSDNIVISERNWLVSLEAETGLIERPKSFDFPVPAIDTTELVYQRYVDADLEMVEASVSLEERYAKPDYWVMGLTIGLVSLGVILLGVCFFVFSRPAPRVENSRPRIDENPTPFTAITVLKDIQTNNGLNQQKKQELGDSINRLEEYYFGDKTDGPEPDLTGIVKKWMKRSKVKK